MGRETNAESGEAPTQNTVISTFKEFENEMRQGFSILAGEGQVTGTCVCLSSIEYLFTPNLYEVPYHVRDKMEPYAVKTGSETQF